MLKNVWVLSFVLIFILGCAIKPHISSSQTYKIIIKTKDIAIADGGFVRKAQGYKSIEIFSAGVLALHVELAKMACLNGSCTTRDDFNRRFFGYKHYNKILDDILDKKAIYGGENKIKTKDGFMQIIKRDRYDILYKVSKNSIYFKDRKNHILIKLIRLQGDN